MFWSDIDVATYESIQNPEYGNGKNIFPVVWKEYFLIPVEILTLKASLTILSKPQPNLNTTVGFDMKMTLHTPPTTTQTFQALLDELES